MSQQRHGTTAQTVAIIAFLWSVALTLVQVFCEFDGDVAGPALVGGNSPAASVLATMGVVATPGSDGYDGQYFLLLTNSPIPRPAIWSGIDLPVYRGRRILLPLLACWSAFGALRVAFWAYHFWNALLLAAGAFAVGKLAEKSQRSPWWGLVFALGLGAFASHWRMLADGAMASLLLCALALEAHGRARAAAVALMLACLCKETALISALCFAVHALRCGRTRDSVAYSAAVIPMMVWWGLLLVLTASGQPTAEPVNNFAMPFSGLAEPLRHVLEGQSGIRKLKDLAFMGAHAGAILAGIFLLFSCFTKHSSRNPATLAALLAGAHAALATLFSQIIWVEPWAYARAILPVSAVVLAAGLLGRQTLPKPLATACLGLSGVLAAEGIAFAALQILRSIQ